MGDCENRNDNNTGWVSLLKRSRRPTYTGMLKELKKKENEIDQVGRASISNTRYMEEGVIHTSAYQECEALLCTAYSLQNVLLVSPMCVPN